MAIIHFELKGELEDIQLLTKFLVTGNWKIIERGNKYYLLTKISDEVLENELIRDKGLTFLEALNGAAKMIYFDFENVTINSFYIQKEEIEDHVILIDLQIKSRSKKIPEPTLSNFEGNDSALPAQTVIEYYTWKSGNIKQVREVLHFFNEVTWINLYKVFEIIRDDVGGQKNIEKLYDKKWIKIFTQAAQSRDLLGDDARHAAKKYKVPEIELSIYDAHKIIRGIFHNWILKKK